MKKYFNPRAQALYVSLCKIFDIDEQEYVLVPLIYMIAQLHHYRMNSIFDFASYLAGEYLVEEIHNGLIGISKCKVDKPFGWYSMLMYMCLFKGSFVFEKEMK